ALHRVIATCTGEDVLPAAAADYVVAAFAFELVVIVVAGDRIGAVGSGDHFDVGSDVVVFAGRAVVGDAIERDIHTRAAGGLVVIDQVGTVAAGHRVRAGVAVKGVVAAQPA